MEYKLLKKEGNEITLEMAFDTAAFEKTLSETYKETVQNDKNQAAAAPFISTFALVEKHPRAMQITREAAKKMVTDNYDQVMQELGIVPVSDPYVRPVRMESGEHLIFMIKVLAVPHAGIEFEGLTASYTEVYLEGSEVERKLKSMRRYYGAATDEELVAKMKQYDSVGALRNELQKTISAFAEHTNDSNKKQAAVNALLAANPMEISAEEIEACVMKEIQKMKNQVGDAFFETQLAASGHSLDSLKAIIRKDVKHIPHLNLILAGIAARLPLTISEEDRKKEIAAQRGQSLQPNTMDDVEETLRKLHENPEILRSLDYKVSLNKALDYVVDQTTFTVGNKVPVQEVMSPYFAQD